MVKNAYKSDVIVICYRVNACTASVMSYLRQHTDVKFDEVSVSDILGIGNVLTGLFSGYPICGTFSRSG